MARISEKDWKKLTKNIKYKGTLLRKAPRWGVTRAGQKRDKAWKHVIEAKESKDGQGQ